MSRSATIYAPATAAGRAGVAVIRLSGPHAFAAAAHLGSILPAPRLAHYTALRTGPQGEVLDRGLLVAFPGPHSFTGEDVLEVHCHGGPAVVRALLDHLTALPETRPAEPGEFSRRAYLNGKMDLTAAEGLSDLIHAETEAQRRQALRQLDGAHRHLFESLRERMLGALALLEACIDFADEDIPADLFARVDDEVDKLGKDIAACLQDWRAGERVREGWQAVILGRPNAGKSSLLNALTRRDAAIVSPIAGTTRDVIEVSRVMGGHAVVFLDTAGLRATDDAIEALGVARAQTRAQAADLRLIVVPAEEGLEPTLAIMPPSDGAVPTCLIRTKVDLHGRQDGNGGNPHGWAEYWVNAHDPQTMEDVERWVTQQVSHASGALPLITRARHRHALQQALCEIRDYSSVAGQGIELQCEHLRQAALHLGSITGLFTPDDVLGRIFGEFCIGK